MLYICEHVAKGVCLKERENYCMHAKPHHHMGAWRGDGSEDGGCPGICIPVTNKNKNEENKGKAMNEIKNGYKVVREDENGKLVSASVGLKLVKYAIGENAKPRTFCGPLTVFNSTDAINGFIASLPTGKCYRVYKCTYVPTDAKSVHRLTINGGLESRELASLPKGTQLAESIYLTEEIRPTKF